MPVSVSRSCGITRLASGMWDQPRFRSFWRFHRREGWGEVAGRATSPYDLRLSIL
jgi:hypothetical protein